MIGLINYGSGNIFAISNIYKKLGIDYKLINTPNELPYCSKLILPGVGAFDQTVNLLKNKDFFNEIIYYALKKEVPLLGICVGMQILGNQSEEGTENGLCLIPGKVKKLSTEKLIAKPHLPHLGWNSINQTVGESTLLNGVDLEIGFYFLHNFFFNAEDTNHVLATCQYGDVFPCIIRKDNIIGVQFHPEKSHNNGIKLFHNFANY